MRLKKFVAIFLLSLYTFNLFGYLLLFHLMERRAEQRLQTSLDADAYNEADLIRLTVPLSLPYVTNSQGFERVDGEITIDGQIFHYVKRAVQNGMLVLLCLPDHQKMKLERAKQAYYQLSGEGPLTKSPNKSQSKAAPFPDIRTRYWPGVSICASITCPCKDVSYPRVCTTVNLVRGYKKQLERPPQLS